MTICASRVAVVSPLLRLLEAIAVASSVVTAPRPMARTNMATISSIRLLPCCDIVRCFSRCIFMRYSELHAIPSAAAVIPFANAARRAYGDCFPSRGRCILKKSPKGGGAAGAFANGATRSSLLGARETARAESDGLAGAAVFYSQGGACGQELPVKIGGRGRIGCRHGGHFRHHIDRRVAVIDRGSAVGFDVNVGLVAEDVNGIKRVVLDGADSAR